MSVVAPGPVLSAQAGNDAEIPVNRVADVE
jgi:hypothetical protein